MLGPSVERIVACSGEVASKVFGIKSRKTLRRSLALRLRLQGQRSNKILRIATGAPNWRISATRWLSLYN